MHWYERTFKKYSKEILSGAVFSILFSLFLLLYVFVAGYSFTWTDISPIEEPSIFVRIFYSALTFVTLGAFLYKIHFYQGLYRILGDWQSFREAKAIIWVVLMALMFFVIVPTVVGILNAVLSFGYNVIALLLYLCPPLGAALILFLFYVYFKKKYAVRGASKGE